LSQYYQKFIDCGYESLEVCALIDDTELVAMDIGKAGHRKALIQACHQLKENIGAVSSKTAGKDDNRKWKEQGEWLKKVEEKEIKKEEKIVENDERHPTISEKKEVTTSTPILTQKQHHTPLTTTSKEQKPKQVSASPQVEYSQDTESSDTIFSESEEEDIFANK